MVENDAEKFRNASVLVIGGAGFIGSHLLETLAKHCARLVCLDNYFTGVVENHIEGVTYIAGCASDINDIFVGYKFDFIFHFGEYSRVEQSVEEPNLALANTYCSFPHVLQFWRSSRSKLIYSASSTKFANGGAGAHLSPYTAAKALNTVLLSDYANWYKLDFSIVYFNNVYGEREIANGRYATVVAKYKNLVRDNFTRLPVSLPGTQRRNFTHVDDIVDGIILAAILGKNQDYQIGSEISYSIIELCEMFGCEPDFFHSSAANRLDGVVDNESIKRLGWRENNSLANYINDFLRSLET